MTCDDVLPIRDELGWFCGICGAALPSIDHPPQARKPAVGDDL